MAYISQTTNILQAIILDNTSTSNVTYVGKAAIGTATSTVGWQIQKLDQSSGLVVTWANGDAKYDNIWDSRTSLVYS